MILTLTKTEPALEEDRAAELRIKEARQKVRRFAALTRVRCCLSYSFSNMPALCPKDRSATHEESKR